MYYTINVTMLVEADSLEEAEAKYARGDAWIDCHEIEPEGEVA